MIMPARKGILEIVSIGAWLAVLILSLLFSLFTRMFSLATYIDYYYPFADLAAGIAGLVLVIIFHGGALTRPWVGLIMFAVADFLYAWAVQTGLYAWSVDNSNVFSLLTDMAYLAAYLILASGFLGHWLLIKYHMDVVSSTESV
jgi:hypothetical protein